MKFHLLNLHFLSCFSIFLITNRGTEEYFGLDNRVTIINSTLGKALGGAAGKVYQRNFAIVFLTLFKSTSFSVHFPVEIIQCAVVGLEASFHAFY